MQIKCRQLFLSLCRVDVLEMEAQAVCEMNQVQEDLVSCPPSLQNAQLQSVVKMTTNMKGKSLDTTSITLTKV